MKAGLAMFTVRESFSKDPMGTLEKISSAGYKWIELVNHKADTDPYTVPGISVKDLKAKADSLGIEMIGAHVLPAIYFTKGHDDGFFKKLDVVKRLLDYYKELGGKYISIPIDFFPTKEYLLERCEVYNNLGELCNENEMCFLYHNHYHEFQRLEGEFVLDLIMANTDPENMGMSLDAYWTMRGGIDPVEKIRIYGKRIKIIHQKDFPFNQIQYANIWAGLNSDVPLNWDSFHTAIKPEHFIEVGDGIMKIQDIIDAGNEFNVPYLLVEQDHSKLGEMGCIIKNKSNMDKMRGLTWK